MNETLTKILINLGVLPNLKGHKLLIDSVMLKAENPELSLGRIYEILSKRHGLNGPSVERNIRTALLRAHNGGTLIRLNRILETDAVDTNYPLTNAQAINLLSCALNFKKFSA